MQGVRSSVSGIVWGKLGLTGHTMSGTVLVKYHAAPVHVGGWLDLVSNPDSIYQRVTTIAQPRLRNSSDA